MSKKDKFGDAVGYAQNQEKYLRVFLTDGDVPIDNNASERAIRGFCIGKKNWQMIDTIHGAKSSAIIYSIVETAKANNLKPFDYVQHLLEEIPKHMNDKDCSFLEDLLPWSENFQQRSANLKYRWLQSSHLKCQGTRYFAFTLIPYRLIVSKIFSECILSIDNPSRSLVDLNVLHFEYVLFE